MNRGEKLAIAQRDRWRCQAHGIHHHLCPGEADAETADQFVPHHMFTREAAKREGISIEDTDRSSNLILVWNGSTGLGAGGCHGRIHNERRRAKRLGLLLGELPDF